MATPTPDHILGKDLNFYFVINGIGYSIAHATDCQIKLTRELLEKTTKDGGSGKRYNYGSKYSYTLSVTEFTNFVDVPNLSVIQDMILLAGKMNFIFTDLNYIQWTGTVLLTESDSNSPFDQISASTLSFQGDGVLTKVTTNIPPIPLPTETVNIIDQFGAVIATVIAPGAFSVLRYDTVEQGGANAPNPNLIITQA